MSAENKFCNGTFERKCDYIKYKVPFNNQATNPSVNKALVHFNGCCLDCCLNSNPFNVCPCESHVKELTFCIGSTSGPCVNFNLTGLTQPIHAFGLCLKCSEDFNAGVCICGDCKLNSIYLI